MSLSFSMPDGMIDLSGESANAGAKKDEPKDAVDLQEMQAAGVSQYDMMDDNGGLDVDSWGQNFDNIAEQISLTGLQNVSVDTISQQVGDSGNEALLREMRELADRTGDSLGKLTELEQDVDESYDRLQGSRNKNLSEEARMEHFATYDPDRLGGIQIEPETPEGVHRVGERHDQDGVYSDVRATINGLALSMSAQGVDWDELNQALGKGGSLESLDQMRDALSGLNDVAMNRAGFAGFGAFFQALDSELFDRQRAENPRGDVRPALGTPEPEVTPPQMVYRPDQQPNGPGTGSPGMSFRAPV